MSYLPSRRRLLAAVAAAGTAAVAGCQSDGPSSDDGSDDSTADDDDSSDPGSTGNGTENGDESETDAEAETGPSRYESPCDAAAAHLEAWGDGDQEAIVEFVPYDHTERYERSEILEELRAEESANGTLVEHDCERSEPDIGEDVVGRQFDTAVSNVVELSSEVIVEHEGTEFTDSRTELWVGLDGRWYLPLDEPGLEVTVERSPDRIPADATGEAAEVVASVVDERGDPVPNAVVIATAGSARLEGFVSAETGVVGENVEGTYPELADHQAVFAFDGRQSLQENQETGTIEFGVPSAEGYYVDDEPNPELLVTTR